MKKVLVFGTFDYLHPGHINFFKQAKKLGDYLTVVIATDQNVLNAKGKLPQSPEQDRLTEVSTINLVNKAVLGDPNMDYLKTIKEEKPDIIALGYDQDYSIPRLKNELENAGLNFIEVWRLKPYKPDKYKSSLLKNAP